MSENKNHIIEDVQSLYKIISLTKFRETPGVYFDILPKHLIPKIDGFDRVIHEVGAISPGRVADCERPWYMHPDQDDNLMVLQGKRFVDIYTPLYGKIESFEVTPHYIKRDGKIVYEGAAMLVWPRNVFHRIKSADQGSASINFAVRYKNFDIRTNFNIYSLDTQKGTFYTIREGYLDQLEYN